MKTRISIANMHPNLTGMCAEFLKGFDYFNNMEYGKDFGFGINWDRMTGVDCDFCVGMDEDAFLIRPKSLSEIIDYMEKEKISVAGMPEKGVCPHRNFSTRYLNPFFVIYNVTLIKTQKIDKDVMALYDSNVLRREGAWGIVPYLEDGGARILRLDGHPFPEDEVSVVLHDLNGNDFLYHTWCARDWGGTDGRNRIMKVYGLAKKEYEKNV